MLKPHQQLINVTILLLTFLCMPTMVSAATDCNAVTEISTVECESLLQLYHSTNGASWGKNNGWNVTNAPCRWYGVTCEVKGVTNISLGFNKLSGSLPNFGGLPHLQRLSLFLNQLTSLPDFSAMPNLQELNLSGNQLTLVPNFSAMPNLQTLDLESNQLTVVPDFANLPHLQRLDLGGNQLTMVPNFSAMPNLQTLSLWGNQLTTVPDFSALPNLQTLYLYGNQLTVVPDFSALPHLQALYLYGNQLTMVPNFSALPNLHTLSIDSNQLTFVPNFSALPNLHTLSLNKNQLSGVFPNFSHLTQLEYFDVRENEVCKDSNVDYASWSVVKVSNSSRVPTWQEELAGFPDCSASLYPIAQFSLSPIQGPAPLTVYLDASESYYPEGNLVEYHWTTSDGRQLFGANQQFTFNNPGTHGITLRVTNNHGLTDIQRQPLLVEGIGDGTSNVAHLEFEGLKGFYQVGESVVIELVETVHRDKEPRVDLWMAVQMSDDSLLFRTNIPSTPWNLTPQAHKTSVEQTETRHHIFDFELLEGMGGDYGLYAAYVVAGGNPLDKNGFLWLRSNLVYQIITLANH